MDTPIMEYNQIVYNMSVTIPIKGNNEYKQQSNIK